jgi:hypothetical protein
VGFNNVEFLIRQLAGFIEHLVGNADFADIVHQRNVVVLFHRFLVIPEFSRQHFGVFCHAERVTLGIRVFHIDNFREGFYDFTKKYQSGLTLEICPAPLTDSERDRLCFLAENAHKALGLGDYSRIDFILDENKKDFYCLEANTLPGMTPMSLLPQEAAADGISYDELCEKIVITALNK